MGNSLQHGHSQLQAGTQKRQSKIAVESNRNQTDVKRTSQEQNEGIKVCQIKRKHSLNSLADRSHTDTKQRKFLSLSKGTHNETSILRDSKLRKGINITANEAVSLRNSMDRFIKFQNKPSQQNTKNSIKKLPIKPRDLPRYTSQKTITAPASLNTIPLQTAKTQTKIAEQQTRPVSYHQQPQITIKYYAAQPQKTQHSLQSSNMTPFLAKNCVSNSLSNWNSNQMGEYHPKKLRKVTMSRSYTLQDGMSSVQNHEDLEIEKKVIQCDRVESQECRKMNICSNPIIKQQEQKENQRILTDPKLMSYIKQNQHLRPLKQSQSKYAVAFYQNGTIVQKQINSNPFNSTTSIVKQKYSVGQWFQDQTLQDKVGREVQSKQLISQKQIESKVLIEQPFRFQTATDISYEQKSENTSFIPISNNFRKNIVDDSYLQDDVLNYCKPKINQKVLADLLRLPLKV